MLSKHLMRQNTSAAKTPSLPAHTQGCHHLIPVHQHFMTQVSLWKTLYSDANSTFHPLDVLYHPPTMTVPALLKNTVFSCQRKAVTTSIIILWKTPPSFCTNTRSLSAKNVVHPCYTSLWQHQQCEWLSLSPEHTWFSPPEKLSTYMVQLSSFSCKHMTCYPLKYCPPLPAPEKTIFPWTHNQMGVLLQPVKYCPPKPHTGKLTSSWFCVICYTLKRQ